MRRISPRRRASTRREGIPGIRATRTSARRSASRPPAIAAKVRPPGGVSCRPRTDGTAWCWGDNGYGQLGNGTTTTGYTPVPVGTATNWITVDAGASHTAGLATGHGLDFLRSEQSKRNYSDPVITAVGVLASRDHGCVEEI